MDWFFTSTTKKHRKFVSEPIGDKFVTELPGIGKVLGGRLKAKGFYKARQVLEQFIVMNRDKEEFKLWLKCMCNANCKQSEDCYKALSEYSNKNTCIC